MDDLRASFPSLAVLRYARIAMPRGPFRPDRDRLSAFTCDALGLDERLAAGGRFDRRHGTCAWFLCLFHDAAWYHDGSRRVALEPGSLVCWQPGSRQCYGAPDDQPARHSYCFPGGPGIDRLLRRLDLPADRALRIDDEHAFRSWLYLVIRARSAEPCDEAQVERATLGLIHDCARQIGRRDDLAPPRWQDLRLLLDSQCERPWTLAGLARRAGVGPSHLSQQFKRWYGCGPIEYLIERRLDQAEHLLASTTLPVAAIAQRVGYADPHYFARLFRKHRGRPPSALRPG